jgi:carbamoyltransferase
MRILGISAFYHDSAAALVKDGQIIAAAQEERFTRKKQDARYPENAIRYCLDEGNVTLDELDYVVFYEKPFIKFERLLETYLAFAPRGFESFRMALPLWLKQKLFQKDLLGKRLKARAPDFDWQHKLLFAEHHRSHAASAFYPSPFDEALILTMDGVGEWATTSVGIGRNHGIDMLKEIHFPHSLGLLYAAFTYYTGFKVNSGEYKVMGLAPYGEPRYANLILDHLIDVKPDGSFHLNQEYFDYCGNRSAQAVLGWRRRTQLCSQRQGLARRGHRCSLGPTGGWGCRRRARCRSRRLSRIPRSAAAGWQRSRRNAGRLSRPRI